jgi:hypothetical protein
MRIFEKIVAGTIFLCLGGGAFAQHNSYKAGFESWGGYTTQGHLPFWLRSNRFGSVPIDGASLSLIGFAGKDYSTNTSKFFDWGASLEGRGNLGQESNLQLIEAYGKIRLGVIEVKAGRSRKVTGLCDSTLSSGSWSVSGNNLGIPEVELSIQNFYALPWFGELLAIKGNLSHGWMGDLQLVRYILEDTLTLPSYLHQKSLYARIGKPSWKFRLYGGFNHQVVWGSEQKYYLDDYKLTPWETYFYVLTGKRYSSGYIQDERQGNHLGSVDIGVEFDLEKIKVLLYRQNFYEVGGLAHLANIQDGLNGLSVENRSGEDGSGLWRKFLIEFLYTKNQAGMPGSPEYGSDYEPYYNHGQYITGWSYKGENIGTPFISDRTYLREGLAAHPKEYFINNRVIALHLGGEGMIRNIDYQFRTSWSWNYGTYNTTDEEQSTGIPEPGLYGLFGVRKQFSAYLELNKQLKNNFGIGLVGAADIGDLYYNSAGLFIKLNYSFLN